MYPIQGASASQPTGKDHYNRNTFYRKNDGDRYNRMCKDPFANMSSKSTYTTNIEAMNQVVGYDVVIVCTNTEAKAAY